MSKAQKQRYHAMLNKISGHLDPTVKTWSQFMNMMKTYLSPADVAKCKNIFDVFETLLLHGDISYGSYDVVKEAVDGIDMNVLEIIEEYTEEDSSTVYERNRDNSKNPSQQASTANEKRNQQEVNINFGNIGNNTSITISGSNIGTSGQAKTSERRRTRSQSNEEDSPAPKRKK